MRTITLKGIPEELYDRLEQNAVAHRRSINSEILVCLERCCRDIGSTRTSP